MVKKEKEINSEPPKSQIVRYCIILGLLAVVILGFYFYLTNQSKNSDRQAEENMNEVQILKQYDLEKQYPKSIREVVKLHCRLLKVMYNSELGEQDLRELNMQVRQLFAEELLAENDENEQFSDLQKEITDFQSAGKVFVNYTIDVEDDISYRTIDGAEMATLYVTCSVRENGGTNSIEEQYLLKKEDGQWKILGWQGLMPEDTAGDKQND